MPYFPNRKRGIFLYKNELVEKILKKGYSYKEISTIKTSGIVATYSNSLL